MDNTHQRINAPRQLSQATLPSLEQELGYASITNLKNEQEIFCWEHVLSGADAKLAYLRAYPKSKETSAIANASRLLKTERVQKRISEIREELQRRYGVDAFSIIRLLAMTMQVDRRQFVDKEGCPLDLHQLPAEAASITDIEIVLDRHGKKHALPVVPKRITAADALAKIMGISKDKVELSGSVGHAAVNIYIPDNGRDKSLAEQDAEKVERLREHFAEVQQRFDEAKNRTV